MIFEKSVTTLKQQNFFLRCYQFLFFFPGSGFTVTQSKLVAYCKRYLSTPRFRAWSTVWWCLGGNHKAGEPRLTSIKASCFVTNERFHGFNAVHFIGKSQNLKRSQTLGRGHLEGAGDL
jgi:hypothetical protein